MSESGQGELVERLERLAKPALLPSLESALKEAASRIRTLEEALRKNAVRPSHGGIYWACHICGEQWNSIRTKERHKPDCLLARAALESKP